jgi:hypothetical protein
VKVVPILEPSAADIAGQLRKMADGIESGDYGQVETAIFALDADGGPPSVFGWGKVDTMRCIGLLHMSAIKLTRDTLDWAESEAAK